MENTVQILGMMFLTNDAPLAETFDASYSLTLVIVSYVFAAFGSYAGLSVSQQIAAKLTFSSKTFWISAGAIAMGGGVWSMHFIGMLAYTVPVEISYDLTLTTLSLFPAIAASAVSLWILSKVRIGAAPMIAGGVLVGGGIGGMHFIGMAAMRGDISMAYDPLLFCVSIVVAVALACAALSVKHALERTNIQIVAKCPNVIGAALMGLAISGMHYVAMAGVSIYPGSHSTALDGVIGYDSFPVILNGFVLLLIILVLAATIARHYLTRTTLLNAIFENSVEGHIVTDGNGIITMASPAVEQIFGYTPKEMSNQPVSLLLKPEIHSKHKQYFADISSTYGAEIMGFNREIVALKKDGGEVPLEISVTDISVGNVIKYSVTVRDITARRDAEWAAHRANNELTTALIQQKQLNDAQSQFITMASHEFRTPLAIIDGAAQRIMRRADRINPEDLVERTRKIRSAVMRMTGLIDRTLDASRFEAGKLEISLESVELKELLRKVCKRQGEISTDHRISIEMEKLPNMIIGDGEMVEQIFTNLLSNAVKYSNDAPAIQIEGWTDGDDAVIRVTDGGVGIPEDELPRLFERFFRARTSIGIPGTGIGLNLVKHLVDLHTGAINVESQEGDGTSFTVRLPIRASFSDQSATDDNEFVIAEDAPIPVFSA